jgi:hypothetical protein
MQAWSFGAGAATRSAASRSDHMRVDYRSDRGRCRLASLSSSRGAAANRLGLR